MIASLGSLYELEISFDRLIFDLKLRPISSTDKSLVREKLAAVIGRGLQALELSKKSNPDGKSKRKDRANILRTVADSLSEARPLLAGLETGLHSSHEIDAAIRIREALRTILTSEIDADLFLREYCQRTNKIIEACRIAAQTVQSNKDKAGRKAIDWFDDFARIIIFIARKNHVRPAIITDRGTGEPMGRFLEIASGFEKLLHPQMRSPSRSALAKRLSRSLNRLKQGRNRSRPRQILSM